MRLDCEKYFLYEKQAFNGLLKIIGIQNKLENINYKILQLAIALISLGKQSLSAPPNPGTHSSSGSSSLPVSTAF